MNIEQLWESVCSRLREVMEPIQYNSYVQNNLSAVRMDDNQLVLTSKILYHKNTLNARYLGTITAIVSELTGFKMNVVIYTPSELQAIDAARATKTPEQNVMFNPRYTFDTFIVGTNNHLAHAAAMAVADAPGESYNPLFIYGGVGLGKTHLMHAIGHYVQEHYPEKQLLYISSERFTTELVKSIRENRTEEFRNRFRNVDVLMVDDIHFIAGREGSQEEFFHTFNELRESGRQIVLSSDRPPQDIPRLEERLKSRFAWGVVEGVGKPDTDTRIAILAAKAQQEHVDVKMEVLELIATNIDSNIRELEGCLNRLVAYSRLMNTSITLEVAHTALHDVLETRARRVINAEMITRTVCEYYSLKSEDLIGPSRRREVTMPRQIAMYLIRDMTTMSLPQIGTAFGNRDHSTVLHACRLVEDSMKTSDELKQQVGDIRHQVMGN